MNRNSIFTLSIIFIMIFIVFSCRKNSKYYKSYAQFNINNVFWKSDRTMHENADPYNFYNNDNIFSFYYGKEIVMIHEKKEVKYPKGKNIAYCRENLRFGAIQKKIGRQYFQSMTLAKLNQTPVIDLPPTPMFFTINENLDVTYFFVDSNHLDQNWIEITKQEHDFKKVWGKFNLVMVKDPTTPAKYLYPDTLNIENGEFFVEF
ncbi:MAG TPA: hypothetical protein PKX92_04590 [Edaphocola sp.]|nr:hypothetical protein [Edaphocola sp.]